MVCEGIDHNPFCVALAKDLGQRYGVDLRVREADIATTSLPENAYDLVVAMSVLEHVDDYRAAIAAIQRTLRPGGVFYCSSTNKFSLRSGEYAFPFYGWLPYRLRRAIRVRAQGPGIVVSSGIDFNQFTYFGLRRALYRAGFSRVFDKFQFLAPNDVVRRTPRTLLVARLLHAIPPLRFPARIFDGGTCLIAVK
jgi:SAM-dependent methyltransferase